jgi:ketosteroid isomerase-like protein
MADVGRDPVAAAAAAERLRLYVTEFGPEDAVAKQRLDELTGAVQVQEERNRRLAAVRQAIQDQKWQEARRLAVEFLKEETDNAEVQRFRSQAETELNRQAVTDTLRNLDAALVKGSLDDAITLLDREAPSYAIERAALADLTTVKARFGRSEHRDLVVQVDGDHAVVRGTWSFTIEVLGQPSRSVTAQHRLRMRRVTGGRWLVSELEVEGEPRVEPR